MKESLVRPVSTTDIVLQETASVNLLNFIPETREYVGLGMVAGTSPNLH